MTKKKATVKAVSRIVEGADAKVIVNIFSPGHEPQEFKITIPNIDANLLYRSPEYIYKEVVSGLRAKFGGRVR